MEFPETLPWAVFMDISFYMDWLLDNMPDLNTCPPFGGSPSPPSPPGSPWSPSTSADSERKKEGSGRPSLELLSLLVIQRLFDSQ